MTTVIHITEERGHAELAAIYAEHPSLQDHHRVCCGGCAESTLANVFGWSHPIMGAWNRVVALRFLLGDDA